MAKSRRKSYAPLPLSDDFFRALDRLGAEAGLSMTQPGRLAAAVSALSRVYTRERGRLAHGDLSADAPLARLGFFLPRDLVKIFGPLHDLDRMGRLPQRNSLRVLDVGAGLGAASLGLSRYLRIQAAPVQRLQLIAIERDRAAAQLMRGLCRALSRAARPADARDKPAGEFTPIELTLQERDVLQPHPTGPFDLVLCGFVLNELFLDAPSEQRGPLRARWLTALSESLSDDGVLIVLEPALKASARELMQVRDRIAAPEEPPFVLLPCLQQGPCPMLSGSRDWCHMELRYALPPALAHVAREAGLRYEGLRYAALALGRRPLDAPAAHRGVRYRVVSERLDTKGKSELFGCGEPGLVRLTQLLRDRSQANRAFAEAQRGDLLEVGGAGARIEASTSVILGLR